MYSATAASSSSASARAAVDRDERMRDVSDRAGGRKGGGKVRSHRPRPLDGLKDKPAGPSKDAMLAALRPGASVLSIRGASKGDARARRVALQSSPSSIPRPRVAGPPIKSLDAWRKLVNHRWNAETQFLNLENLADDELVIKHRLSPPGSPGGTAREAAVIFKLASQLEPEVTTISLANNNIHSGQLLTFLPQYLPNLSNLSLQNNQLRTRRDFDFFSERKGKMMQLRELILVGNPFRETMIREGKTEQYRNDVAARFPSLEILDMEPIVKIGFDAPESSTAPNAQDVPSGPAPSHFPCMMGASFITGVEGSVISNFLGRFFNLFDTQRDALVSVYHPNATFSFSANTSIPVRARLQGLRHKVDLPNQGALQWAGWVTGAGGSRNLDRIALHADKAVKTLHVGAQAAVNALKQLPRTAHDVAGAPEQFCVDAWPAAASNAAATLFVTIHGQFNELPVNGVRSFDRSFILSPAPEGSAAKADGWDVVVLSDQLCVRHYSGYASWLPGPMLVHAGDPVPPMDQLTSIPEPQRTLVVQVSQRSGLTIKFSVDCLENNGWDVDQAMLNFEQVKGTLGKEAFL